MLGFFCFSKVLKHWCVDCFTQVKVGNHTAEGTGTNKKVAKRNAAENMLEILGFKVPQTQPAKPALKSEEKVTARAVEHGHLQGYTSGQGSTFRL
jgi:double-stranded RNA-binding protein Staufen